VVGKKKKRGKPVEGRTKHIRSKAARSKARELKWLPMHERGNPEPVLSALLKWGGGGGEKKKWT